MIFGLPGLGGKKGRAAEGGRYLCSFAIASQHHSGGPRLFFPVPRAVATHIEVGMPALSLTHLYLFPFIDHRTPPNHQGRPSSGRAKVYLS